MCSGGAFRLVFGLGGWGLELGHDAVFVATLTSGVAAAFGLGLFRGVGVGGTEVPCQRVFRALHGPATMWARRQPVESATFAGGKAAWRGDGMHTRCLCVPPRSSTRGSSTGAAALSVFRNSVQAIHGTSIMLAHGPN